MVLDVEYPSFPHKKQEYGIPLDEYLEKGSFEGIVLSESGRKVRVEVGPEEVFIQPLDSPEVQLHAFRRVTTPDLVELNINTELHRQPEQEEVQKDPDLFPKIPFMQKSVQFLNTPEKPVHGLKLVWNSGTKDYKSCIELYQAGVTQPQELVASSWMGKTAFGMGFTDITDFQKIDGPAPFFTTTLKLPSS